VQRSSGAKRLRRQLALAFARLLVAFVVLAGIAHSGARYFYCDALGLATIDPCVRGSGGDVETCSTRSLQEHRDDCCRIITLPSIPNGARLEGPFVPPAAVLSTVSAEGYVRAFDDQTRSQSMVLARWRTPPRSAHEVRSQLMVFLT
jgi:hypothetical protein